MTNPTNKINTTTTTTTTTTTWYKCYRRKFVKRNKKRWFHSHLHIRCAIIKTWQKSRFSCKYHRVKRLNGGGPFFYPSSIRKCIKLISLHYPKITLSIPVLPEHVEFCNPDSYNSLCQQILPLFHNLKKYGILLDFTILNTTIQTHVSHLHYYLMKIEYSAHTLHACSCCDHMPNLYIYVGGRIIYFSPISSREVKKRR
jgi:hypothetical protein